MASPVGEGRRVVIFGEGIVRGVVEHVRAGGPFTYGKEGSPGGVTAAAVRCAQDPGEEGWYHFQDGGVVTGEGLRVEMRGRGVALQGVASLWTWTIAEVAFLLKAALLIAACLTSAWGKPVGFLLFSAWAVASMAMDVVCSARRRWRAGGSRTGCSSFTPWSSSPSCNGKTCGPISRAAPAADPRRSLAAGRACTSPTSESSGRGKTGYCQISDFRSRMSIINRWVQGRRRVRPADGHIPRWSLPWASSADGRS